MNYTQFTNTSTFKKYFEEVEINGTKFYNKKKKQKLIITVCESLDTMRHLKEIKSDYSIITNEQHLQNYNFTFSKILVAKVNHKNIENHHYLHLLNHIYTLIDDGSKIIKNSNSDFKIKTIETKEHGYHYLKKVGISFRAHCANSSIKEIVNQCMKEKIHYYFEIELN